MSASGVRHPSIRPRRVNRCRTDQESHCRGLELRPQRRRRTAGVAAPANLHRAARKPGSRARPWLLRRRVRSSFTISGTSAEPLGEASSAGDTSPLSGTDGAAGSVMGSCLRFRLRRAVDISLRLAVVGLHVRLTVVRRSSVFHHRRAPLQVSITFDVLSPPFQIECVSRRM